MELADEALPTRPLRGDDRCWVEPLLRAIGEPLGPDCPAELSFSNLLLFDAVHRYEVIAGPLPAIAGLTYDGVRHVLPLFELSRVAPAQAAQLLVGRDVFYPLALAQVERLPSGAYTCTLVSGDDDYLYAVNAFLDFPGPARQNKRRLLRQLLEAHRMEAQPLGSQCLDAALAVLDGWLADKRKQPGDADDAACRQALAGARALGLCGYLHTADGEPVGWVLAEPLFGGTWAVRFAKGRAALAGLYPWMFQHLCRELPGVRWLNFEQDLGLPGLRRSKLSYGPERLLPKYRARPHATGA